MSKVTCFLGVIQIKGHYPHALKRKLVKFPFYTVLCHCNSGDKQHKLVLKEVLIVCLCRCVERIIFFQQPDKKTCIQHRNFRLLFTTYNFLIQIKSYQHLPLPTILMPLQSTR